MIIVTFDFLNLDLFAQANGRHENSQTGHVAPEQQSKVNLDNL